MNSIKEIKRRFTVIIGGLFILFIINLFYLSGLYHAIKEETAKIMIFSIEEADGAELQSRLQVISALSDSTRSSIIVNKSIEAEDGDSAQATTKGAIANTLIFNQLMQEVRQTIHQTIDSMLLPNLPLLDSLIYVNFRNKGIFSNVYYSEIVNLNTGAIMASSCTTKAQKSNFYLYEYDSANRYAYKVYTAPVARTVLGRMFGILSTTLLTVLLLAYSFWYFIKTILRQKTLEEMKEDFTNNMTHELKTPISIAYSAVDTLLNFRQGESSEKRRQYLNICIEQLSNLRDLVEQILSMSMERSKNISLKRENIPLKPVFDNIANQQRLKTDKQVDIEIQVLPENLTVYADTTHISNIIDNLMDNALKYSSDHVIINMSARRDEKDCILSIKDNGIGISVENQKHIFDRFYRVPHGNLHEVKGYGLGLFYVKTMVEQHQGQISVKSEINKGTEFTIKIPVK
jgi:signal transduction histidine kinase